MLRTVLAGLLLVATAASAHGDHWVHVAVDGNGDDPERVRVNVPLSLVETVLPLIEDDALHHGKIVLEDEELSHADIVQILRAVGDAKDGEYVTVEDGDDRVRVAKEGDMILVKVEEGHGRHREHVDVSIPVAVLNALVSGDEDELDLVAAITALGDHGTGDLVTVQDEDGTTVRIWIDKKNVSD